MTLKKLSNPEELTKLLSNKNHLSVLNFSASWCGPCKILTPQIETLSQQNSFRNVSFAKIFIDDQIFEDVVDDCQIKNVPTTIIYLGKTEIYRYIGAQGAIDEIKKFLMKELNKLGDSSF